MISLFIHLLSYSVAALKPGMSWYLMSASDYAVKKLPGLSDSDAAKLKLFAGHIPTNETTNNNHIFFSLVEAEKEIGEPKLV